MRSRNASRTVTRFGQRTLSTIVGFAIATLGAAAGIATASSRHAAAVHHARAPRDTTPRKQVDSARTVRTISADSARSIVRMHLPDVRVTSQQLRRLDGRLVYAFRLRSMDGGTLMRATVDAITGAFSPSAPLAHRR